VSDQNVELHRRVLSALNARDLEAVIALCGPTIELHSMMTVPGGAIYRGRDGVRKYLADLEDAWGDDLRIDAEAYFDLGEYTLMFYVAHGRGRQSGADVEMEWAQVCRWRNGLIVHFKPYVNREDALSDLSISEEELEPIAP
jgi:ketosteroid isomerase-like protein